MSLTSYRAAPPRVRGFLGARRYGQNALFVKRKLSVLCRPGDDLLSHVLRQSTIGAKAFDGRVRDGIGSYHLARATRPAKDGSEAGARACGERREADRESRHPTLDV